MPDVLSLIMIAAGFIIVLVAMAFPRLVRSRRGGAEGFQPGVLKQQELRSLERVEERLLELEETSRDIFARLDTRGRMLIRLIEEAEYNCQQIQQAIARKRGEA